MKKFDKKPSSTDNYYQFGWNLALTDFWYSKNIIGKIFYFPITIGIISVGFGFYIIANFDKLFDKKEIG